MTSSFSAAAAAGSVLACSSSVIRVVGARGIARCEGVAPIGHMEGCAWQICRRQILQMHVGKMGALPALTDTGTCAACRKHAAAATVGAPKRKKKARKPRSAKNNKRH